MRRRATGTALALTGALLGTVTGSVPPARSTPVVHVWLTTPDQRELLAPQPDVAVNSGGGGGATIHIDPSTTHQPVTGFGAALTDSSAWLVNNSDQRDEIMSGLFDPNTGIGLTALRQPIGASESARVPRTHDDVPAGRTDPELAEFSIAPDETDVLPLLRQARELSPELSVLATPWSPPAWMKIGGSLNGGGLDPRNDGVYADYLVRHLQEYAQAGVPVGALTVQNAPLHAADDHASSTMSAEHQARFLAEELGPRLDSAGLDTALFGHDDSWGHSDRAREILAKPEAAARLTGTAFHCDGGNAAAQDEAWKVAKDKSILLTDCTGVRHEPPEATFARTLADLSHRVLIPATRHHAGGAMLRNVALDPQHGPRVGGCENCTGLVEVDEDAGEFRYQAEYYALGHFSKFVRPGAVRVDSTEVDGVDNVAFRNTDGSTALLAFNHTDAPRTFAVSWLDIEFEYTLPAGSLATFSWPVA